MSERVLEVSTQAFAEIKDRLIKSRFGDLDFTLSADNLGEIITFHGLAVQSAMGFENQEFKALKAQLKRLREPLIMSPDVVRHAIEAVSDADGCFNVEDVCDLAIKIMEIKQHNEGEK